MMLKHVQALDISLLILQGAPFGNIHDGRHRVEVRGTDNVPTSTNGRKVQIQLNTHEQKYIILTYFLNVLKHKIL